MRGGKKKHSEESVKSVIHLHRRGEDLWFAQKLMNVIPVCLLDLLYNCTHSGADLF